MAKEIRQTFFEGFQVLHTCLSLRDTAVILQRSGSRDQDDAGRSEACHAALDIEELFRAEVRAEAGLRDRIIGELQGNSCRSDRITSVRNIRERSAMDKGRCMLKRLDQIRFQSIL